MTGQIPKSVADTLRNIERQGNPWGIPAQDRTAWAEGLEIRTLSPGESAEALLFLGCAYAFDARNRKAGVALVRLMQAAGVDFAILGMAENCCGETARRLGHEYIFQVLAEENVQTLKQYNFERIITPCPHCYNTLKNEYPQFGGDFQVEHTTELFARLPSDFFKRKGSADTARLTFQDSCYLGRYNQIYEAPREALDRAGLDRVEMDRRLENGFCCGGGGGGMWMETDASTRINHRRMEDAIYAGADVIATACPYCLLMLDDAIRSRGVDDHLSVVDVVEVLVDQMKPESPVSRPQLKEVKG
jgi:Fe-S oxidoreductase